MPLRIPPLFRSFVFWLLVAIFAFEFFLFDHYGARRFTGFFPRWHDQVQYLTESYTGYEFARSRGLFAGLLNALTNPSSQGTLHDFFTLFTFSFTSPSRSAALSLNMFALILWQAALFFAVVRTSGSRPLAFATALLPLVLVGPWENIPGSAYDFRLDHLAMCAIGLAAAAAIAADSFYSRAGATWFGVAVGVAVLTRFRTGPYFVLIFAALAGWILLGPPERRGRGLNLLRAAGIAAVIAVPTLWLNYEAIAADYSPATYLGPASGLRGANADAGGAIAFVFEQLGRRHLGVFFGVIAVAGTCALALLRRTDREPVNRDLWGLGGIFLLAPAVVLILHPQKSEVLTSALVPGVITLVAAAWSVASRRAGNHARTIFAAVVTVAALAFFIHKQVPPAYTPAELVDLRQINTLAVSLQTRARLAGLREPKVSVDHVSDALDGRLLGLIAYERRHAWLPFETLLPAGVGEPAAPAVMERVARSDFVLLTEQSPAQHYPYDRALAAMAPQLRAWCDANLRATDRFTLAGRSMVLYQRREIPLP